MKNPMTGTFTKTINTFNEVTISNGLLEALESSVNCLVSLPLQPCSAFSFESIHC